MKSCLLVNRLLNTFSTNKKVSRIATVQKSLIPVEISHFCLYIYVPGGCEKQTWETSRCPDASEMPLQWSNYTHPNLYLLESHARSASLLTCLCGGLGYGTRYSWCAWLTDWPATAAILGVWGYISRVLAFLFIYLFIYLFSFRCLILAKFWCASILHTPVTTKEKWAAGSQRGPRCWAGRNSRKNKRTKAANCFIPKLIRYISSI